MLMASSQNLFFLRRMKATSVRYIYSSPHSVNPCRVILGDYTAKKILVMGLGDAAGSPTMGHKNYKMKIVWKQPFWVLAITRALYKVKHLFLMCWTALYVSSNLADTNTPILFHKCCVHLEPSKSSQLRYIDQFRGLNANAESRTTRCIHVFCIDKYISNSTPSSWSVMSPNWIIV